MITTPVKLPLFDSDDCIPVVLQNDSGWYGSCLSPGLGGYMIPHDIDFTFEYDVYGRGA